MNAAVVCVVALGIFLAGYHFYSRLIERRVFGLTADEPVPAHEKADGVDYVATPKSVLFGHHYSSIAGAAPIIGPAIAVVWGWGPALLWIVFGSVLMGAVHDFATLVISIRHGGQSIGQISATVLRPRVRTLFLLVVFFLVFLVIAVFAKAIATLFVSKPGTVLPINFEIVVALAIGHLCYRRKVALLVPSLLALISLYAMVYVGVYVPLSLASVVGSDNQAVTWVVLLLVYSYIASALPVWTLLQPRDYINSHQLFVGLALMILGLLIAQPSMTAPMLAEAPADAPSMMPFLFVTIACGAISGFHGLVSSGTTSKQVSCATDARAIGYGGMLGEGVLAVLATLAVSAGLADWAGHYHSFGAAAKGGVGAFVEGAASFLMPLGIPRGPAEVLVAVLVISFAATSLDTGVRIQRYIVQELAEAYGIRTLSNRWIAGAIAVVLPLLLVLGGKEGSLWPLFGASNQLLAGLSLVVVSVWVFRTKGARAAMVVAVPMAVVLLVAAAAMVINLGRYWERGEYLLVAIGGLLLVLEMWVTLEGIAAVRGAGQPS